MSSDIGQLASEALTALTDPAGVGLDDGDVSGRETYMESRLNAIIRITDPIDSGDEEEFEALADSLDALGRNVETIRERIEEMGANRSAVPREAMPLEEASVNLVNGLNAIDVAVQHLRSLAEPENECEDCAVNGDDCREHGQAFRVARRAVLANPARVIDLLGKED